MKTYNSSKQFLHNRYDPINNPTINYRIDSARIKRVLSFLQVEKKPTKLLDIGCYNGHIGSLIREKLGGKCQIYGIDTVKNAIKLACKNGINALLCDVSQGIDFTANEFDYIFAGEIIEHLYDTDFFMREVKRVLKPNGTFIITTPNFLSLGRRIYYVLGKGIFMEASLVLPKNAAGHIRYFTFETFKELAQFHNFIPIKMFSDTVNFPGFKIDLLARTFPTLGQSIIAFLQNKK